MDFTDYLLVKLIVVFVAAVIWGIIRARRSQ